MIPGQFALADLANWPITCRRAFLLSYFSRDSSRNAWTHYVDNHGRSASKLAVTRHLRRHATDLCPWITCRTIVDERCQVVRRASTNLAAAPSCVLPHRSHHFLPTTLDMLSTSSERRRVVDRPVPLFAVMRAVRFEKSSLRETPSNYSTWFAARARPGEGRRREPSIPRSCGSRAAPWCDPGRRNRFPTSLRLLSVNCRAIYIATDRARAIFCRREGPRKSATCNA